MRDEHGNLLERHPKNGSAVPLPPAFSRTINRYLAYLDIDASQLLPALSLFLRENSLGAYDPRGLWRITCSISLESACRRNLGWARILKTLSKCCLLGLGAWLCELGCRKPSRPRGTRLGPAGFHPHACALRLLGIRAGCSIKGLTPGGRAGNSLPSPGFRGDELARLTVENTQANSGEGTT
ncbi:hypothetical protein PS710_04146 [Pseudomonas fluorescens]|uniref:Uncharacterized protein n=1 Tax=Pseudomonas fluorescens TaxID=294 RepID=A0A5E7DTF5_PSEFL|nr:hypothetical protein PS710_04146 [Pseudomonas fluorescens]